jgi:hypothetical protein
VRNLVWDHLHGFERPTPLNDIDVVWFDRTRTDFELDAALTAQLMALQPDLPWSVRNQARMHERNGDPPYLSTADAMRHWPETATAIAARLLPDDVIEIVSPLGLDDLVNLTVRPSPHVRAHRMEVYRQRQAQKNWRALWPRLRFEDS